MEKSLLSKTVRHVCARLSFGVLTTHIVLASVAAGLPVYTPLALAATGNAATGGGAIAASNGGGAWTSLTGPSITNIERNDINDSNLPDVIVFTAPAGYEFDTGGVAPVVTVVCTDNDCNGNSSENVNNVAHNGTIPVVVTAATLTITITDDVDGSSDEENALVWQNVRIRPTVASATVTSTISRSTGGNNASISGVGTNFGTLAQVHPGCASPTITVTSGNIVGGPMNGLPYAGTLVGTSGDDIISGPNGGTYIDGKGGNDVICGGNGNDILNGGDGNDLISGGNGSDAIYGGSGDDDMWGDGSGDNIFGGTGSDEADGGSSSDRCNGGDGADSDEDCESDEVASISITKDASPDAAQNFTFVTNQSLPDFDLDDDADAATQNLWAAAVATDNQYTFQEGAVGGWSVASITCNGGGADTTVNQAVGPRTATVNADDGEEVFCTFVNNGAPATGTISIQKQTLPDGDTADFTFTGDITATLSDGETSTPVVVNPGTYSVTESTLAGWQLTDITCSDGDSTGVEGTGVATFVVAAGENVTCTYTNTKNGTLRVNKTAQGGDATFDFSGEGAGIGEFSILTSGGTGFHDISLVPGNYEVTEEALAGWQQVSNDCASVTVNAGQTTNCTIVNTKAANITVQKQTVGGVGAFTFNGSVGEGSAQELSGEDGFILDTEGGNPDSETFSLFVGTNDPANVNETAVSGWNLTDITCNATFGEDADSAFFSVSPGSDVTCTFTNTKSVCGNAAVESGEVCDDGNEDNSDGCTTSCLSPTCGDTFTQTGNGEQCDDGDLESGDGCSASCQLEICGDETIDFGEQCDDGDTNSGDGCSATCQLEVCGDGIDNNGETEECDDGNIIDNDACSNLCVAQFCGDNLISAGLGEVCDDGNGVSNDGCSATCQYDAPSCAGTPANVYVRLDGVVVGGPQNGVTYVAGTTLLEGTGGNDVIVGTASGDKINGKDGNDTICGEAGEDDIEGKDGADTVYGGAGNDQIKGQNGADTLYGQGDHDTLEGGDAGDYLDGAEGADVLKGQDGPDELHGGIGEDQLFGNDGEDLMFGGADNDTLTGGNGPDRLDGDAGDDQLNGNDGDDVMHGGDGEDSLYGNNGNDKLRGQADADYLEGGNDNDEVYGGGADDELFGNNGADLLCGRGGADVIEGNNHDDRIDGGDGSDTINGGNHDDLCVNGETVTGCETTTGSIPECEVEEDTPVCGDGVLESPEQCDDTNTEGGDGCSATCEIEVPEPVCGDGNVESPETCDDSNTTNGDGCSAICEVEIVACEPTDSTLVSHWKLDETSGPTALDSGDGENDGTFGGSVLPNQPGAPLDYTNAPGSYDFDGEGSVSLGTNVGNFTLATPFTISAWINPELNGQDNAIYGNTWSSAGYLLRVTAAGKVRFIMVENGGIYKGVDSNALTSGWHHVVGSWDGTNVHVYVDGVEESVTPIEAGTVTTITTSNPTHIGATGQPGTMQYFDGQIDDVRVYSSALPGDEIANLAAGLCDATAESSSSSSSSVASCAEDMMAHWKFEETVGIVADDSIASYDATLQNGLGFGGPAAPVFGSALGLSLDGSDDEATVGEGSSDFAFGNQDFTVSVWTQVPGGAADGNRSVLGHFDNPGEAGFRGWGLYFYNNGNVNFFGYGDAGTNDNSFASPVLDGGWHNVVGVYKRSGANLTIETYVDGVLVGTTAPATVGNMFGSTTMRLGRYTFQPGFKGNMDDVRVYGRALSADEVATLSGGCEPASSSSSSSESSESSSSSSSSEGGGEETSGGPGIFAFTGDGQGNGGHRGSNTNVFTGAANFVIANNQGAFGGGPDPRICAMQRRLGDNPQADVVYEVAEILATVLDISVEQISQYLTDPTYCEPINTSVIRPVKQVVKQKDIPFYVNANGLPVSRGNLVFDLCVAGKSIPYPLVKSTGKSCDDYYMSDGKWKHPDHPELEYFTLQLKPKVTLTVPAPYKVTTQAYSVGSK